LLDMQSISLKMESAPDPVVINTAPFFLKNLTWLLLEYAMEIRGGSDTLYIAVKKTETCVELCFSGLDGFDDMPPSNFPTESMQSLLDVLKAEVECNIEKRQLILKLYDLLGSE
jgi:hypothetical protein